MHAVGLELFYHTVGPALGTTEDERLAVVLDQSGRDRYPLGPVDLPEVVSDVALRLFGRFDGHPHGVVLVGADDRLHLASDRGREEEDLALGRPGLVQQAAHCREEPHVGHAICLVEHHGRDVVEPHVAALDQVLEASRAGHHDVDAVVEGAALVSVAGAAEDGHDPLAVMAQQSSDHVMYLRRQLVVRHEHQRPGPPRADRTELTASGIPKASVLPDPVGALPQISLPVRAGGIVSD